MIWIGTSGWVYPHWVDRFYPPTLPIHEQLPYYARYFPTVEINRSFYRLPTSDQFRAWVQQVEGHPDFLFAVKASRYLTHMKKLLDSQEGIARLLDAAKPLSQHLGPFLYQLPPHWRANPRRLEEFISHLPRNQKTAFEFRDPTWFQPENFQRLYGILSEADCTLVIGIGGSLPTPLELPTIGSFGYVRVHNGEHGIGLSDAELDFWAKRLASDTKEGREIYVYFNNDPDGYAVRNALRLRDLLGTVAVQPS